MASVADLARGYSDEKWKTYVHRLNACRNDIIDELMNASPENKQQRWDAYNKTFNERDDNIAAREAWTLHRLSNRLIHSTETAMRQQGDLEQNEADIDDYLEEYSELGKHIDRIGADFDRFKDYEDFVEQSKAALKKKNELTERLEAVPEGHLSEAGIQKNLKTLKETHKVLEKQDSTFRWQLGDMDEEIKAQEKIADAAKAEMEKVQSNADTIEEANRKEKEKLENFRAKADHLAWSGEYLQQEKLKIDENGRFGRRYMDKTADNIYFGLQSLHTTAMVGKKPGHRDTAEYRGMMDRYDALIAAGEEGLQGKSPEEIKQMLTELKTGAENYIRAKQAQKFQSFRHSPMRKMRLDFAQNLMKLCDESTKQLDKMNDRVKGVQRKYDTFCKPVVNKWGQKLKPDEAMSVIKENRAMMLEKARVKKQESPSRSMNA